MRKFNVILASLLLVLLCGCAGDETDKSANKNISNDAITPEVGMVLNAPEKTLDEDASFYVLVNDVKLIEDGKAITPYEMIVDNRGNNSVVYISTHMDYVFEWDANGEFYAYYSDTRNDMNGFAEILFVDENEKNSMEEEIIAALSRVGWLCPTSEQGITYLKCEDAYDSYFEDVWVYEMFSDGRELSTVYVDKDTGLWVQKNTDGQDEFYVIKYSESELKIPDYK